MSMISELVDRLRRESKSMGKYGVDYMATLLMQASDTIVMLSEKARADTSQSCFNCDHYEPKGWCNLFEDTVSPNYKCCSKFAEIKPCECEIKALHKDYQEPYCEIEDCDYHKYCKERGQTDCSFKADTPQTDCYMCKWIGDRDVCGRCRNRNLFAVADTPQTDCPYDEDDKCFGCGDDTKCVVFDTPQTDYPCNTCANKGDHDGECQNCVVESAPIRWETPSHYKPKQTDCAWK